MHRITTIVVSILILLLLGTAPGFAAQSFAIIFDSFQDFDGDGRIDCSEPATYRISVFGTNAATGGDRGTITVPFSDPVRWIYTPGSFVWDPIFSERCGFNVVSGNEPADRNLVVDYFCDPRSGNPLDDNYAFSFKVSGLYVSSTPGPIIVDAQNVRTFPDSETQKAEEATTPPLEPCPPPPDLRLAKSVASGNGEPGSVLTYTLALTNAGGAAASVTLRETVPAHTTFSPAGSSPGWTCSPNANAGAVCLQSLGTLAAGAALNFTFAVVVDATLPANPEPLDNTACVSTPTPGDPTADNCGSTSTPPGGNPDLRVVKTTKAGTSSPGDTLVYQIELSNHGNRGAANAILRETVPPATSWDAGASSPGWFCSGVAPGSTCLLPIGTVAAGASLTRDFALRIANPLPPGTTEIANTACVDAEPSDPSADNCSTITVQPGGNPDLHLTKTLASGTVAPDAVLVYDLTATNEGNRAATSVVLQETVPTDTTFEAGSSSPGWSCNPGPAAGSTCTLPIGSLAAGASSTFRFAVRIRSDLPPTARIGNTACLTQAPGDNDPPENNCATLIVDPPLRQKTDIELALAADEVVKQVGEEFAFVLTVRNTSDVPAQNLRITVTLPNLGTPPTDVDSACRSIADVGLDCSLPSLAPGEQVGLTWFQKASQAGSFVTMADLAEAQPEDVDSTPGNASRTEDDFAELAVEATLEPVLHDVPALTPGGLISMSGLLLAAGVTLLLTRRVRSLPSA